MTRVASLLIAYLLGGAVGLVISTPRTLPGTLPQCERPAITPPIEAVFYFAPGGTP